jgi:hypothetical protein
LAIAVDGVMWPASANAAAACITVVVTGGIDVTGVPPGGDTRALLASV